MGEVEPETIRRHERAILLDVRSQHVAQCRVHEMGSRVISGCILSGCPVYGHVQLLTFSYASLADLPFMQNQRRNRTRRFLDVQSSFGADQDALIADLT